MENLKLTYFDLRGIAEPIRWILIYSKVPFEDERIDPKNWYEYRDANESELEFGQVPILKFNGKSFSQSTAICRYLAKKYDLIGESESNSFRCDILVDSLNDLRLKWVPLVNAIFEGNDKRIELERKGLEVIFKRFLSKLEKEVGEIEGNFAVCKKVTWADLWFANSLQQWEETLWPNFLDDYPNLNKLKETVLKLPEIKEWVKRRPKTFV